MHRAVVDDADEGPGIAAAHCDRQDYVPLMLATMSEHDIGLRALAARTGISKSRLGLLLHREAMKRRAMTLAEFQRILAALEIDLIEAVVTVEILASCERAEASQHRQLVGMLCEMFRDLPINLIAALEEVGGVDGTEVRAEWAPVLQRAVIKRLVHEISAVVSRREALSDFDLFSS